MSALLDSLAGPARRAACARRPIATVSARIAGIPCTLSVTHYLCVKPWRGSAHTCPSSDDYYGYTECEFEVCDQRGRPAPWLEKKLTESERERLTGVVQEHMEQTE